MTDASKVFSRILKTLDVENASQAAKKLGLAKQSVYEWRENIPSLDNLIRIAESGNTSLDYLIKGENSGGTDQTIEKILEQKIREIVRTELKDTKLFDDDDDDEINYFSLKQNAFHRKLISIKNRIRSALHTEDSEINRRLFERFKSDLLKFDKGEIPTANFLREVSEATGKNVIWLVTGEGEENIEKPEKYSLTNFVAVSANSNNAIALHQSLEAEQRQEKIAKINKKRQAKQIEFRRIVKEEINEYMKENLKPTLVEILKENLPEDLGFIGGIPEEYKPPTHQDTEKTAA